MKCRIKREILKSRCFRERNSVNPLTVLKYRPRHILRLTLSVLSLSFIFPLRLFSSIKALEAQSSPSQTTEQHKALSSQRQQHNIKTHFPQTSFEHKYMNTNASKCNSVHNPKPFIRDCPEL